MIMYDVNSAGQYGPTSAPLFSIGNYRSSKIHFDVSTWTCEVKYLVARTCLRLLSVNISSYLTVTVLHSLFHCCRKISFSICYFQLKYCFFFLLIILTVHLQGPTTTTYLLLVVFFLNCRCLSIMDVPLKVNLHFSTVFYLLSSEKDTYIRHVM